MEEHKLWNALKDAKKYKWVELSHSLNNDSPYWSGIPDGSVELANLDKVQPAGAVIVVSYPRIEGATGLPARVWAITE